MTHLDWKGKPEALHYGEEAAPAHLAQPRTGANSRNLLIHGDNLRVLKTLLPEYRGKIDLISIDPPYNARNESWIFPDPVLDWGHTRVGAYTEDALRRDKWLSMMYYRIITMRQMLSRAGSLWMTLDDNAVHLGRLLLDEVFGEENFVACVVWERGEVGAGEVVEAHSYVLVYAREGDIWRPTERFSTLWGAGEVGTTRGAARELAGLMGVEVGDLPAPPKPVSLLGRIVGLATRSDSVVLDCFAGGGALGHAVYERNRLDGGDRCFILVESGVEAVRFAGARLKRVGCEFAYLEGG